MVKVNGIAVDYSGLPGRYQTTMQRYLEDGIEPGSACRAILENDLAMAIGRADSDTLRQLPQIVKWLWNEIPEGAWGSKARVSGWMRAQREAQRHE